MVAVCNPNNPTGAVLSPESRAALVALTARHGAWLMVDEVYRGAEREGPETESFFGAHERVLVTGGMSKAYGLPGLRIGWVAGPRDTVAELWARRDYVTISPGTLSDVVAARVLRPDLRMRLLDRTRGRLRANDAALDEWRAGFDHGLTMAPPRAGAIAFLRYAWDVGSSVLCDRLREEQDVLVVPGDHFGLDRHLRIGLGNETADLRAALDRVGRLLRTL
jgi:aspartate/methionine/tyrosine aminotransferase